MVAVSQLRDSASNRSWRSALNGVNAAQCWRVAILLMLALALKPVAIIWVLLFGGLYWRLGWRMLCGMLVLFLLPFLIQMPHYVWQEYQHFLISLESTVTVAPSSYAQVFSVPAQWGIIIPNMLQDIIRMLFAVIVFALSYVLSKSRSVTETTLWVFTLASCYLLLFNPRTEGNDYIVLAPAIGFMLMRAIASRFYLTAIGLFCLVLLFTCSYYLVKIITPVHNAWLDPFLGLCFFAFVIYQIVKLYFVKKSFPEISI